MNASIASDIPASGSKHLSPEAQSAAETVLYGVTGWPLAQSLSPLLHNTGFTALGLRALYLRWEIPPQRLSAFVDSVRTLRIGGCSVTIPHKVALLPLPDEAAVGALHVIVGEREIVGEVREKQEAQAIYRAAAARSAA